MSVLENEDIGEDRLDEAVLLGIDNNDFDSRRVVVDVTADGEGVRW